MDVRLYTDKDYIPLKDLQSLGENFLSEIREYRRSFIEVVPLDDLNFVNIVETPTLVKKRYAKNIEIKGRIEIDAENHDYILAIAKAIVQNLHVKGLKLLDRDKLIKKFEENQNDLTIVTEYITKNIDRLLVASSDGEVLEHAYPELSRYDIAFIRKYHDPQLSYAISDFQELNKSSYETGRKSMEKLAELGLYEKVKVGKKFVYRPQAKLGLMLEGGKKPWILNR